MTDTNATVETTEAAAPKKVRGKNKPLQGKFEIEFLKETAAPERKPLQGGGATGPRDTVLSETLKQLQKHPGALAVIFTSPDPQEVFTRRVSLINAADRLGIKLDVKNTASRAFVKDGQPVMTEDGSKQLYALYAMVAV